MNANTKARTIMNLLESAAQIAQDLARDLADNADTVGAPAQVDHMVGAVMHAEPALEQLADIFAAVKTLQRVAVQS